jgi:hypothetical protein
MVSERIINAAEGEQLIDAAPLPEFSNDFQEKIDQVELAIASGMDRVDCPVRHIFTPGMYGREIFMPAGSVVVSKIHKTEHPYIVSQGVAHVFIEGIGWHRIQAPFTGVTKPMTRRVLLIEKDCVWTTFHATEKTDVEEIEKDIIVSRTEHFAAFDAATREQLTEESK